LLCGPFPGRELTPEERRPIDSSGYSQAPFLRGGHLTDCLTSAGGEPNARPLEGDTVEAPDGTVLTWRSYASPTPVVDFEAVFGVPYTEPWPYSFSVLYGFTVYDSPNGGPGYLEIGSDDSGKVYLNGRLVHDAHVRHCTLHRDYVPATWERGQNTILVKVENCGGPGGFLIRAIEGTGAVPITFDDPPKTIWIEVTDEAASKGISVRHTDHPTIHVPLKLRWDE
jgi:hypothetical protein